MHRTRLNSQQRTRAEFIRRVTNLDTMTERMASATRAAVLTHKRAGNPIAIWRDGDVVIVQPEDIEALLEDGK
jgi:hypothetical protein